MLDNEVIHIPRTVMLTWTTLDIVNSFLGLVVIARVKHLAPFRTQSLSTVALMVLRLKTWESKSLPNLVKNSNIKRLYLSFDDQ